MDVPGHLRHLIGEQVLQTGQFAKKLIRELNVQC
jgi:hypothetical protein